MAELGESVLRLRLSRESASDSEELQVSLIWNDIADLDLHVVTPRKEEIYFGHKESKCGGWLDVDMNVRGESMEPVENVFWASSPSGKYKVFVRNFSNHVRDGTVFTDPQRKVPFVCYLTRNGERQTFSGSAGPSEDVTCFEFTHKGNGAVGSFVVLPPAGVDTTFKEAAAQHEVTYTVGSGYYAVARKEKIQAYKDMLLHDIASDTFTIGHDEVCEALGWPTDGDLNKGPKDIKEGTRLFVQSTSHNRKIPADTHVLIQVPVKEALKYRQLDVGQAGNLQAPERKKGAAAAQAPAPAVASTPKRGKKRAGADAEPEGAPTPPPKQSKKKGGGGGGGGLSGKAIVFTGTLSISRSDASKAAEGAGASVKSGVSAGVDIVVAGPGAGAKLKAAEKHGCEVWDEDQFKVAVSMSCWPGGV